MLYIFRLGEKMKKLVVLLGIIFVVSGCEATYNLEIDSENIKENLEVLAIDTEELNTTLEGYDVTLKELILNQYDGFERVYYDDPKYNPYEEERQPEVKYYNQRLIDEAGKYGIGYDYKFTTSDIYRSQIINSCYKTFSVSKNKKIYTLRTDNVARCFQDYSLLDKVVVNVKVLNRVVYANADRINDDVYTWIITRDNAKNKIIKLSYTTSKNNLEYTEEDRKNDEENEDGKNPDNPSIPDSPKPGEIENPSKPGTDDGKLDKVEKEKHWLDYILVAAIIGLFLVGVIGLIVYKGTKNKK